MTEKPNKSGLIRQGAPAASFAVIAIASLAIGLRGNVPPPQAPDVRLRGQSSEAAQRKSSGCVSCHSPMDEATMHPTKTVQLGCTDCHGGDSSAQIATGTQSNSPEYSATKQKAHKQ